MGKYGLELTQQCVIVNGEGGSRFVTVCCPVDWNAKGIGEVVANKLASRVEGWECMADTMRACPRNPSRRHYRVNAL